MGLGDDLMITYLAKKEKAKYPERQIVIGDFKKKLAYHSIIYEYIFVPVTDSFWDQIGCLYSFLNLLTYGL